MGEANSGQAGSLLNALGNESKINWVCFKGVQGFEISGPNLVERGKVNFGFCSRRSETHPNQVNPSLEEGLPKITIADFFVNDG